jgi:N-acetyl sugar amidotransferase
MQPALSIPDHHDYQLCVRCVMDTSDPLITFDEHGVCSHCQFFDERIKPIFEAAQSGERMPHLLRTFEMMKQRSKKRPYDCVLGISGGVDSSYVAYIAKQHGLRVLLVHCDSGWNSETAVKNIEQIATRLSYDLHTTVVDWPEMQDLQRAFFKSGVANCDIPQDHAYIASVYHAARKHGVRYILNGSNFATEAILPSEWGYLAHDLKHLRAIHKRYGERPLSTYPSVSFFDLYVLYPLLGIRSIRPLNDMPFVKAEAKDILKNELGWKDYGGKHYESIFTKFFQSYYLVERFGYDKRRAHLASLVLTRQITRDEALKELQLPAYDAKTAKQEADYIIKKLGFSPAEWEAVMNAPLTTYRDFASNEALFAFKSRVTAYVRERKNK